jgi:hypothetical protein
LSNRQRRLQNREYTRGRVNLHPAAARKAKSVEIHRVGESLTVKIPASMEAIRRRQSGLIRFELP